MGWCSGSDRLAAGCAGLAELAKPLGRAIVKFGTCDIGRLTERRRELGQQRYGSIYRSPSGYISEKGWAFWESFPRLQVGALSSFSPVRGSTESLIVTLPQGMTAGRAEALINRALLRYSLRYFADCDLGRKICAEQGILPDRLVRHSPGPNGSVTAATELLLLRPQADASRLAGIIADVIVGHVLGSVPDILKL